MCRRQTAHGSLRVQLAHTNTLLARGGAFCRAQTILPRIGMRGASQSESGRFDCWNPRVHGSLGRWELLPNKAGRLCGSVPQNDWLAHPLGRILFRATKPASHFSQTQPKGVARIWPPSRLVSSVRADAGLLQTRMWRTFSELLKLKPKPPRLCQLILDLLGISDD